MDWGTNPRFFFLLWQNFTILRGKKKHPTTSTKDFLEKMDKIRQISIFKIKK
jgi:hypothetical protein